MERKWKRCISCAWRVCLLVMAAAVGSQEPVLAAEKSYVLQEGKTSTIQLDGKGAKEKIKFEVQSEEIPEKFDEFGNPVFHNNLTIYVNGKSVYETQADTGRFAAVGQMYVTSIDNSDAVRDIFVAMTGNVYVGEYELLEYCRFENGKMEKKQDLKNYLDKILPKDIGGVPANKEYIYYHSMYELDKSLWTNGNKELTITIDLPTIYDRNYPDEWACYGEYHADYTLKLKNGKLVKRDKAPHGSIHTSEFRTNEEQAIADKTAVFYSAIDGPKKAFTVKRKETVYLNEYKYVNGVLYLKGEKQIKNSWGIGVPSGKSGWIKSRKFYGYTGNHV